jgi:hypothetical protein
LNWENKLPFLSTDELAHAWAAWKGKRAGAFINFNAGKKEKEGKQKAKDDICRRYNTTAGCSYDAKDCKTFYGNKLRHVCSHVIAGGKKCEKDHPKHEHK